MGEEEEHEGEGEKDDDGEEEDGGRGGDEDEGVGDLEDGGEEEDEGLGFLGELDSPYEPPSNIVDTNNLVGFEEDLRKNYRSNLEIRYPDTENERNMILSNIEEIVRHMTESPVDLDFLRDRILEENVEEIMTMDLCQLSSMDLRSLPWFKIKFETISLSQGSTILEFRLTFKEPPRNLEDVNVYRLMELFILATIDNIDFIKSVKPVKQKRESGDSCTALSMRLEAHNTSFDDSLLQKILSHVRGTIALVNGQTACDEQDVELILNQLMSKMSDRDISSCLHELDPRSLRELIQISMLPKNDAAKITFEFYTRTKLNRCIKTSESPSTHILFPFDFRKISDLSNKDIMDIMIHLTKHLPERLWYEFMTLLAPTFHPYEMNAMQEKFCSLPAPYSKILEEFSKKGGTLGDLLKAMEKLKSSPDLAETDAEKIQEYVNKVEAIRINAFDTLLDKIYCPSTIPHVKSMQEFEEMVENTRKLKTTAMKRFSEVRDTLEQGDQLWIFRQRWFMRSYAHVVIVGQDEKFIHVSAPDKKLKMRSRAKICEDSFADVTKEEDICFVIRPPKPQGDLPSTIFRWRAEVCLEIRFDYDAALSNCETFANAIHGMWTEGHQVGISLNILILTQFPLEDFD